MRAAAHRFAEVKRDGLGRLMNRHQVEKTAASIAIAIRSAVATSLNHSEYDTHASSGRHYCCVIIAQPRM
jgi:hypothetical protein